LCSRWHDSIHRTWDRRMPPGAATSHSDLPQIFGSAFEATCG
jgi:hypothetical protein